MSRYYLVNADTLKEMIKCFASEEEYLDFHHHLTGMSEEMDYIQKSINRNADDKSQAIMLSLKKLFILGVFVKENIEVIHQIIAKLQYKEKDNLTDEEKKRTDTRW